MSATPLTNDKADEIIVALNAVTEELKNCLAKVSGASVVPVVNPSGNPTGNPLVSGGPLSTAAASSNITLTLLLKVADAAATNIDECRIVNTSPKDLPASRAGELWFTHQVEFIPGTATGTGTGAAMIGSGEFIGNAVTFLGSIDKNKELIKIQDKIIENIKLTIDDKTTGKIDPVYLKYDSATNPPWSVGDGSEKNTNIILTPDIVVGKGTGDANKYIICFADESNFAVGTQIKMIDGTTEVTATADTITQINAELAKTNPIPTIKGGRRRRQTRKGGKRYRRKSRRFR